MKLLLVSMVAALAVACADQPKERELSCQDRLQKVAENLNSSAGTCYELGACLGKKAEIVTVPGNVYINGQGYAQTYYSGDGVPIYNCQVGKAKYRMDEVASVFHGCMAMKETKCGTNCEGRK